MALETLIRRVSVEATEQFGSARAAAKEIGERITTETQRGAGQAMALAQTHTEQLANTASTAWTSNVQCFGRTGDLRAAVQVGTEAAQSGAEQLSAAAGAEIAEWHRVARLGAEQVSGATRTGAEQLSAVARTSADHVGAAAVSLRQRMQDQPPLFNILPRREEEAGEAWGDAEVGTRTVPPLVLRMVSSDQLTPCSMEVEWENGSGIRQHWSSHWHPLSSFFEAEKVLPCNITHVSVRFKVQAVVKSFYVEKVNRHQNCSVVHDAHGETCQETFWFMTTRLDDTYDDMLGLDMTFELKGLPSECHVSRTWNSGRGSLPARGYESWPDHVSRPRPRPPLKVLQDADSAALPRAVTCDPLSACNKATQRLAAAAKALQEVRRETLAELRCIDEHLTRQWVAVNSTNTAGAGLAVASAAALFVNPLVGIGLGVASAATSGVATAGDYLADKAVLAEVRRSINEDDMNVFAVASLQQEWLQARDRAGVMWSSGMKQEQAVSMEDLSIYGLNGVRVGLAVAHSVVNVADTAGAFTVAAESAAVAGRVAPVASKALGVAGAVVSTGMAVHGWVTTKSLQALTRKRLTEISQSMLGTQRWLAAMSELQCTICLSAIALTDEVQCCKDSWHYSHRRCLEQWDTECRATGRATTCPLCCGPVSTRRGRLEDLMMEDMRMLVPHPSN